MTIRRVATVVPAEGAILERVLDATYPFSNGGLTRHAYGRLDAAQTRTVWGRGHRRRFALVDGVDVLASVSCISSSPKKASPLLPTSSSASSEARGRSRNVATGIFPERELVPSYKR